MWVALWAIQPVTICCTSSSFPFILLSVTLKLSCQIKLLKYIYQTKNLPGVYMDATWWAPFRQTPFQTKHITLAKDISALSNADAQDARGLACISCVYLEHQLHSSSEMKARLVQYGDVTGSGVNKHSSSWDNKLKCLVDPPVICVVYRQVCEQLPSLCSQLSTWTHGPKGRLCPA